MPRTSIWRWAASALALLPAIAGAQDSASVGPYARAVATWISLIAAPGYERVATDKIMSASPGWTRDAMGNLVKRAGTGSPTRVVACGLDETGYVVGEITDDGYLRVQTIGNTKHVALWAQYHEGQRVVVQAVDRANSLRTRNVAGVFAVRSNHLWRNRVNDETPASIENLWVDVGARSRADVLRMGIDVLDPVVRDWPEWTIGNYVSGPAAANRAGCEAVAAAASSGVPNSGRTIFVISAQKAFDWTGLTSAIAHIGRVDSLLIVDRDSSRSPTRAPWARMAGLDIGVVSVISPPARYAGTLTESVSESDIATLNTSVARAAGLTAARLQPATLAHGWYPPPPIIVRDSLSKYADMLGKLTDIYAVTGHEAPNRAAVRALLPAWARDSAVVDTAGNLILAMGPNRDTAVFVAHLDELGYDVTKINDDGTVDLRVHGSFFPFLWEGQPAVVERSDSTTISRDGKLGCSAPWSGQTRGIFLARDSATQREPRTVTAWFGQSASELAASGVTVGSALTIYKCSARIGETRFTSRSVDDRAGDTALLFALDEIDPAKLDHKVIFVWSTREEGGLLGAKALAATLGPSVHRVHAVDTFVSADSPVESHRFAYAPIGAGAVVRALDNSSVTQPDEIERMVRIAHAANIPLQVGVTNGGNDGSEFARWGAENVSLAWPLRYSHSAAEVIDLRDLRSLARIVAAAAKAPTKIGK